MPTVDGKACGIMVLGWAFYVVSVKVKVSFLGIEALGPGKKCSGLNFNTYWVGYSAVFQRGEGVGGGGMGTSLACV